MDWKKDMEDCGVTLPCASETRSLCRDSQRWQNEILVYRKVGSALTIKTAEKIPKCILHMSGINQTQLKHLLFEL